MDEERIEVDGVPARTYVPDRASGLLLFGHGGGSSKDEPVFVDLCRRHADETGLAVVCIDAVGHGERRALRPDPTPSGWHSGAIDEVVADWEHVVASLSSIGPAVAYVGCSMGSIFGLPTVAALPTLRAAVFVVGGIPEFEGHDDPALGPRLLAAAAAIDRVPVRMLNKEADEIFPAEGTHAVFDALATDDKELRWWPGGHASWPDDLVAASVAFIRARCAP